MALEVAITKRMPGFALDVHFTAGRAPVALLGASGSGKTLTLRAIAGLIRPETGRIALDGRTLFDSGARINVPSRARRIGLVFQNYALFSHLTVAQNIEYGLHGMARAERSQRMREQVQRMHLDGYADRYPHQLSGGQQQRVALARALAPDPDVLLLDEPLAALDVHLRSQVEKQLIETLADYDGVTVLVSHNLEEAYRVCRQLVVLDAGRCVAAGSTEGIFRNPPTLAVARVTGCKNFSSARRVGAQEVEAIDWNCTLRVSQPIPDKLGHVAIRAHHIAFERTGGDNTFPAWLVSTSETPFRMTLYLRLHAAPDGTTEPHLQAEVFKEKWQVLQRCPQPFWLRLAPDDLFLLPD
jgi:molybdate transport system permease protein